MHNRKFIYDRDDWPNLSFDPEDLRDVLATLYRTQGHLFGKLEALGFEVQDDFLLDAVSDEVLTSFAIEGEKLDAAGVRSSVARRLNIERAGVEDIKPDHYTEGIVEMALDATRNYKESITHKRLYGWHAALFPTGHSGTQRITVGAYRKQEMEIVSGPMGKEKIHYIAPPPERVHEEMRLFLKWFESNGTLDPYIKAGLAHLIFEAIHPFDDGNGRIGRAIVDLLLARAEKSSQRYYSLSSQMLKERKAYYRELEFAQAATGDTGEWLKWFLNCLTRAITASDEKLDTAMQKAKFFEHWRNTAMNERQLFIMNKMIDGFEGKLTTTKWAKMCKCSHDTALRDIDDLVQKGMLLKEIAGGRSTSYAVAEKW